MLLHSRLLLSAVLAHLRNTLIGIHQTVLDSNQPGGSFGPDTGSPWQSLEVLGLPAIVVGWLQQAGCFCSFACEYPREKVLNTSKDMTSESHLTFDRAQVSVA